MRNLSITIPATATFTVAGLGYFPGEITSRIVHMMWAGSDFEDDIPKGDFERDYDAVWQIVYDGSLDDHDLAPSMVEGLRKFRTWLQGLETDQDAVMETVHILGNLNAGHFLAFVSELDPDDLDALDGNDSVNVDAHHLIRECLLFGNGIINDTYSDKPAILERDVEVMVQRLLNEGPQEMGDPLTPVKAPHSSAFAAYAHVIAQRLDALAYSDTQKCVDEMFRLRSVMEQDSEVSASERKLLDSLIDISIVGLEQL